jgi:hypothetical protein
MALTEEERTGLVGWLLTQIAYDEEHARKSAKRHGADALQATIQANARRQIVRSFEWWLCHGSDALAAMTLGELATMYADRLGYPAHCRALTELAASSLDPPD